MDPLCGANTCFSPPQSTGTDTGAGTEMPEVAVRAFAPQPVVGLARCAGIEEAGGVPARRRRGVRRRHPAEQDPRAGRRLVRPAPARALGARAPSRSRAGTASARRGANRGTPPRYDRGFVDVQSPVNYVSLLGFPTGRARAQGFGVGIPASTGGHVSNAARRTRSRGAAPRSRRRARRARRPGPGAISARRK